MCSINHTNFYVFYKSHKIVCVLSHQILCLLYHIKFYMENKNNWQATGIL